jgi:galactose mutarotase-like enzyme
MRSGGEVCILRQPSGDGPWLREARVYPGLGMNIGALVAELPGRGACDIIAPLPEDLGEPREAYQSGGAFLIPFANRLRKTPDGPVVAHHGFFYDHPAEVLERTETTLIAKARVGDFGGRWSGDLELSFRISLEGAALRVAVTGTNRGSTELPLGIGWHSYLVIPSGDRHHARLRLPAHSRLERDHDVLPTGRKLAVPAEFHGASGAELGDTHFDDCFTDFSGPFAAELRDPAGGVGFRIASRSRSIRAAHVYTPPGRPWVALEPQFNLPDPLNEKIWGRTSGMTSLGPGESDSFEVTVSIFELGGNHAPA